LKILQALLRSTGVFTQVRAISVQMRGGAVRYQAQVLRKLRIPKADKIPESLGGRLSAAADSGDQQLIDALADEAFAL